MKNLILMLFVIVAIMTSIVLFVLKFTTSPEIGYVQALMPAFTPFLASAIIKVSLLLFNRFEAFVNTIINVLMF